MTFPLASQDTWDAFVLRSHRKQPRVLAVMFSSINMGCPQHDHSESLDIENWKVSVSGRSPPVLKGNGEILFRRPLIMIPLQN